MNRVYPLTLTACICMAVNLPQTSFAQCNCTGQDTLVQFATIDTSNASQSYITFHQYNDPTHTYNLSCFTLEDTLSLVSNTKATNTAASLVLGADFFVTFTAKITGPAMVNSPVNALDAHGPYDLGALGALIAPLDSVVMGPDTVFNKKPMSASPTSVVPYIGTGMVSDTLQFGGGGSSDAGVDFAYAIHTKYWGQAKITFYLCPNIVLASSIRDFTATQNGSYIQLQWNTDNEQNNTQYEIQISPDGKRFTDAGDVQGTPAATGSSTKYQYQYNLDQASPGTLYFRIKRTDGSGKVTYSAILTISPGPGAADGAGYNAYPNPATSTLLFRFNTIQTGRFLMELISTAGQVVEQKVLTLTGSNELRMDLSPKPASGLYFLRTTDITHNQHYISKVLIN